MIVDPNQMLIGFVSGFAAGIFTAYKFAQRQKVGPDYFKKQPLRQDLNQKQVNETREADQIIWEKKR